MRLEKPPESKRTKEDRQENLLKYLLESGQDENLLLALQLLSNQEVLTHFLTHFLLLSVLGSHKVNQQAQILVKEHVSQNIQDAFYGQDPEKIAKNSSEKLTRKILENIAEIPEIDQKVLGNLTFRLTQKGASFCLKYKTNTIDEILKELLTDDYLDLSNLNLEALPTEIEVFKNIKTLDISGNAFTEVPSEIKSLSSLQNLFYIGTPLSKDSVSFLISIFPHIFANKHYRRASQLYNREQYKVALKEINNALSLNPNNHHFWNAKGIIMKRLGMPDQAIVSFKKALSAGQYEISKKSDFFQQGKFIVKETWNKTPKKSTNMKAEKNLNESNNWQSSLLLQKANAFHRLGEYEEAFKVYQKIVPHYYQVAPFWYQLSTTLYYLKKERGFILTLKQAITLDKSFLERAKKDFGIHHHPEFKNLFSV